MKIAVTGGSGFLGSRFVELHKNKFDNVVVLNSQNSPLNDLDKLIENTKNIDVLVHTAFDHSYKDNIKGIKNILQTCKVNNIKKLIHLSTISVYDPNTVGVLNENSPYTKINDPYSKEKRDIERVIEKHKDDNFDIVILQPTIVYGLGGNWTKYALHACKSKALYLPNNGENICNAVYVDDVANAIYKSCYSDIKFEKIIISGNSTMTWRDFYIKHCNVLSELQLPSNCNIQNNTNKNEFHSNSIVNFIFILWFKTPLGNLFNLMISGLKKLRSKSYADTSSNELIKEFLESSINNKILTPLGITKRMHTCNFKVDISIAKKLLNYNSKFNFDNGIQEVKNDISKALKK